MTHWLTMSAAQSGFSEEQKLQKTMWTNMKDLQDLCLATLGEGCPIVKVRVFRLYPIIQTLVFENTVFTILFKIIDIRSFKSFLAYFLL